MNTLYPPRDLGGEEQGAFEANARLQHSTLLSTGPEWLPRAQLTGQIYRASVNSGLINRLGPGQAMLLLPLVLTPPHALGEGSSWEAGLPGKVLFQASIQLWMQ